MDFDSSKGRPELVRTARFGLVEGVGTQGGTTQVAQTKPDAGRDTVNAR
jgi:hypothetical protein